MERIDDYRLPWVHEATITDPTGLRVQVLVTIPPAANWDRSDESTEIAQMQASQAMRHLTKLRKEHNEECPF